MFWLGLIVSLCYVPGVTGAFIATQWPVLGVLLSFGLLRSGPFTTVHALGLLFMFYAAAHSLYTPAANAAMYGLWLVLIMGLCVWFGTTMKDARKLYKGLAAGAALSSAVSVFQYLGYDVVATMTPTPAGIYVNGVQQGAVLALIVVALASERLWLWALPLMPGIYLSHSRGALLALAVGLLGCYVRRLWVFAVLGIAGAFYLLTPLNPSDQLRIAIWSMAWHNLTLFGWGPGVFFTIIMQQESGPLFPEYAHNDALQLLFEYGVGALLPFAVFAYALSRTDAKEWPVVLAFVVAGCYSMPLFMPVASFLALAAVGRIIRSNAVGWVDGDRSRQRILSGRRGGSPVGCTAVPVAPYTPAKG